MVRFILALGERSKIIDLVGYTERVKLAFQTGSEYGVRSLSGAAAVAPRSKGTGMIDTVDGRLFITLLTSTL